MTMKVGFVGLGLMGQAMSHNLVKNGYEVFGYDILPGQIKAAEKKGVVGLGSPKEVARKVALVISSVPNAEIVEEIHCGTNGTCEGAKEGTVVADTSTISPEDARRIADRLATRGLIFIDAPISGASGMVAERDCLVMAGGDREALERCMPVFNAISKKVFHVGPTGAGSQLKLVHNHLIATITASIAEAFALGIKAGIDPKMMVEAFVPGAAGSKMLELRGPLMVEKRYAPQMKIEMFLKDLRLIMENGQKQGAALPLAGMAQQMMTACASMGYGQEDVAAVLKVYERLAGIER
jgi:2-hydroxy-3-oxopropionate reductase